MENKGLMFELHNNRGAMAYGIAELEAENPLAWPSFASIEEVKAFPPSVISVNECDPLRDEESTSIANYLRLESRLIVAK